MTDGPFRRGLVEAGGFGALVVAVTAAMIWTVWAFSGAILWAVVLAVVFSPLKDRLHRAMPNHEGRATLLTLLVIIGGIMVPVFLLVGTLVREALRVVTRLQTRQIDLPVLFDQSFRRLPDWMQAALHNANFDDLSSITDRLTANIQTLFQAAAGRTLSIGSDVLGFVLALMITLYLSYVLLRNGHTLIDRMSAVVPLEPRRQRVLAGNFVSVVRATVKGSIVVALAQGAAGGVAMWLLGVPEALLWAVVMAFGALLPAVGTGLVWVPVSIYLLATGHVWQGIVMALAGAFIIGSIDNVLRPILVGRETQMPDALVFVTTLGGLSAFGVNGLIIGPVVASLFLATWEMVREDRQAPAEG